jgi:hypothetical protein
MKKESSKNSIWDIVKSISTIIASILIPIVIVIVSKSYTNALKEKEISIRYVEIATKLLNEDPKEGKTELRNWAIETLNYYSKVPIDVEAMKELREEKIARTSILF